ncbi:hypothetical protein Tco_0023534 [Tanacetum coccineum]
MVGGVAIREHVAEEIQRLSDVKGKGKAIVTEKQAAHSLIDLLRRKVLRISLSFKGVIKHLMIRQRDPLLNLKMIHQRKWSMNLHQQLIQNEQRVEQKPLLLKLTKNKARSDPRQGHEALAGSNLKPVQEDSCPRKEHVTLAGPNPEHMNEDFYATSYPKVHENLKLRTDEHVIFENPESSSATLSSMKNLDETDNFGDQFLNDKPIKDDQEKTSSNLGSMIFIPAPTLL